jgi:hypothetical protein
MEPAAWKWTMDYSRDRRPPTRPALKPLTASLARWDDFEEGPGQWGNYRGDAYGARVQRVERGDQAGGHCLRMTSSHPRGLLHALAFKGSCDLKKHPVVSFEYRIPEGLKVNMQALVNGGWYELRMTSPARQRKDIGTLEVEADGKWHRATVDLLERVQKLLPGAAAYELTQIAFIDPSRSTARNLHWEVDNFAIAGYGAREARFAWSSRDITGIAGYAVSFAPEPTAPGENVTHEGGEGAFAVQGDGVQVLTVRARDSAGNWSAPARVPYFPLPAPPAEEPDQADARAPQ